MSIWEVCIDGRVCLSAEARLNIEGPDDLTEEELMEVIQELSDFAEFVNVDGTPEKSDDVEATDLQLEYEGELDDSDQPVCRVVRDGDCLRVEKINASTADTDKNVMEKSPEHQHPKVPHQVADVDEELFRKINED